MRVLPKRSTFISSVTVHFIEVSALDKVYFKGILSYKGNRYEYYIVYNGNPD